MATINIQAQDAQLSVQGVLRNANGTAVENGQFEITFKLYDHPTGGTLIWQETKDAVDVEGGIYSVNLGDGDTPLDAPFDQAYYLGVSIEGGTELIPRAKLTSSPYALSLIGSENVFPNAGNVGIGNASPTHKLTIQNETGAIGLNPEDNGYTTTLTTATEGFEFNNDDAKDFIFIVDGDEKMRIKADDKMGLGTDTPQGDLHVKGEGKVIYEGSNTAFVELHKNGFSNSVSGFYGFNNSGDDIFRLENNIGATDISSTGNIGLRPIGGSVEVHTNGEGLKLMGTDHSLIGFYPDGVNQSGFLGYNAAGSSVLGLKNTGGNIEIDAGNDEIHINSFVEINGNKDIELTNFRYMDPIMNGYTGVHVRNFNTTFGYSLVMNGSIKALFIVAHSDNRIKKDLKLSNNQNDLATLRQIEVTDYKHIDEVTNGSDKVKGLIAQQVEEVFPEAVSYSTDFIPNIFQFPTSVELKNTTAQINLSKPHDMVAGDKVKMITDKGVEIFTVAGIVNEKSFTVENWEGSVNAQDVFISGKEVDDFRAVNYDRVFTLAVSATQELARKVEALEKENTALRNEQNNTKAELNKLSSQMKNLESIINASAKK